MAVILKLDGVSKSFARVETNDVTAALSEINLEMKSGEFISLVGTSGCGKSTMLRLIAGLIQPTTGTLSVNGEEITVNFEGDLLIPNTDDYWWWTLTADSCKSNNDNRWLRVVSPSGNFFSISYFNGGGVRPFCIFSSSIFESGE